MTDDELLDYPMARDPRFPLDPPAEYARLRRDQPVTRVRIWDGSTPWLITRYDDVLQALTDRRLTMEIERPGFPHTSPGSAARAEGTVAYPFRAEPEYLAHSRMLANEFTARRIESLRPNLQRIVDHAVDGLLGGPPPVDFIDRFALPVAVLAICDLLGMPHSDGEFLHATSRIIGSRTAAKHAVLAAFAELNQYFARLVAARIREPGDDLIGRLVRERILPGELSAEDAASMIEILYFAGHGPAGYMIAMGTAALLRDPAQLAALRDAGSPERLASGVEELLRYITVSHNARQRVAIADTVVGGQRIRAGEGVLIQTDAANRDDTVFSDPDRLDLHREPHRHFAFGHGLHRCVGRALARVELQVVFETLLRRIPTLRLAVPIEEVPFKTDENLVGAHCLLVAW